MGRRDLTYQRANRALHCLLGLVEDVARNRGTNEELDDLIAEVVAVVAEEVVGFWCVARADLLQKAFKVLLGDMCDPEMFYSGRSPVWRLSRLALLDASPEVVLFAMNHHTCMPVMTGPLSTQH